MTVEVLTAEVRTLKVGSRQVTLTVAKQLDSVAPWKITPFGRVRIGNEHLEVIGSDEHGNLVVSHMPTQRCGHVWRTSGDDYSPFPGTDDEYRALRRIFLQLPLIVLAGLK
jgi:hypothetical protein